MMPEKKRGRRAFHEDDGGFTTVGMVLALLITLSLVFCSARVYEIERASGAVQNVADAAALAAENQVAEFYLISTVCDAVLLSLSLTGITAICLGVVALCTPPTAPLSEPLIEAGRKIMQARDRFADRAAEGLNGLQKLLPYLAAAQAASVVQANNDDHLSVFGFAVLLPVEGQTIEVGGSGAADELLDDVDRNKDAIREAAQAAEEAAQRANEDKMRAYRADCGAAPGYCMYERAGTLAGMSGSDNPYYASVDAWSFSVALARAQAYYPRRLAQERPTGTSVEERADSALRTRLYTFACKKMETAYVHEDADAGFDADFPLLPKNTDEMRACELYTERVYPTSLHGGSQMIHAWAGCPRLESDGANGTASIADAESGSWEECPACRFTAASLGKVAAASTSIDNGFEHHYRIVAEAAEDYRRHRAEYEPQARAVKGSVGDLFSTATDAFSAIAGARLEVFPPGRVGAVSLVVDRGGYEMGDTFSGLFRQEGTLGTRAAISAATLVDDPSTTGDNVIAQTLDGYVDAGVWGAGALDIVADLWGGMLSCYGQGQQGFEDAVSSALDAIPLAGTTGLGDWAAEALSSAAEAVGLQPVEMDAKKPVIVNTAHVLREDDGSFSQSLLQVKTSYVDAPGPMTGNPLSAAVGALGDDLKARVEDTETITVANIELLGDGGPSVPIQIPLPPAAREAAGGIIDSAVEAVDGLVADVGGLRVWR